MSTSLCTCISVQNAWSLWHGWKCQSREEILCGHAAVQVRFTLWPLMCMIACNFLVYLCVLIVSWTSRDPEAKDKMNPFAEQEAWEEHQIGNAAYLKQTPTSFSMISLSVTYGLRYIFRKRLTWKNTMYLFQENRNCDLDPKIRSRLQMSISKSLFLC
jgi:hypothetical protein